jgi:hypothetical protein
MPAIPQVVRSSGISPDELFESHLDSSTLRSVLIRRFRVFKVLFRCR